MRKSFLIKIVAAVAIVLITISTAFAQKDQTIAQTVVHLLSYVSMDYPEAVENGEIIDQFEYEEQQEFSEQAYNMTREANFLDNQQKEDILALMQELIDAVNQLKPAEEISRLANTINNNIIFMANIETAPKIWPDIANGKKLYAANCASCHGDSGHGDGLAGINLEPSPSDFFDDDLMDNFSAFQAYNSIRFGVSGTGMQAYSQFSEEELWDLAFFVKSLRAAENNPDTTALREVFDNIRPAIGLKETATYTDKELLDTLKNFSENPETALQALRLIKPTSETVGNSLTIATAQLQKAQEAYENGDKKSARNHAITAYLDGIEPVESQLRSIDPQFVIALETQMFKVREAIEKDADVATVQEEIERANNIIKEAEELLSSRKLNFWLTFILSFSVVVREALEAFLIIAVVISLIRSAKAKKALAWVNAGWITALLLGVAGWFLSDYIIKFGGKNREIMEGLVSLLAVIILIFAGFWLHNKTYAEQWTKFVEEKIGIYLTKDHMLGLAAFSFVIVFREAFEVILFLQAINLEAAGQNKSAIGFGTLAGFAVIALLAYIFLKYTKNLPVKYIFQYSSYLIVLLAVILMGKGVHSLQESGWISITALPSHIRIAWLGIYPTVQTVAAQLGLIAVVVVTYFINKRKFSAT